MSATVSLAETKTAKQCGMVRVQTHTCGSARLATFAASQRVHGYCSTRRTKHVVLPAAGHTCAVEQRQPSHQCRVVCCC
jgi:hypothetical protein